MERGGCIHAWPSRRILTPIVVGILIVLLPTLAGCARHSDAARTAPDGTTAHLLVTADFGATVLHDGDVAATGSVLDGLRAVADVRTSYGGGFVRAMFGRSSDIAGQRDWLYYVDGVLADRGADQVSLSPGASVWWDHRHWAGTADAHAVVGAWPRPFTRDDLTVAVDPPLAPALAAAGAHLATGRTRWQVRVGADADLRRREPAWSQAVEHPDTAGLTGRVDGDVVLALDARGDRLEPVTGARAVAVAVPTDGDAPADGITLVVAGVTADDARAAARTIADDPTVLRGRVAQTFDADGRPVRAAGRATP